MPSKKVKSEATILYYPSFVSVSINGKTYEGKEVIIKDPKMVESVKQHIWNHYGLMPEA